MSSCWYLGDSCTHPFYRWGPNCVSEQTQGLHLQAKFHLNVFIVSASGGQKPQFWTNFDTLGGSGTDHLLPMRVKFGVLQQTARTTLSRQISSECVHCIGFRWPKTTILGKFWLFGGSLLPTPFYQWRPTVVCYSRPTVYTYMPNFVWIGLFCCPLLAKKPQFLQFFVLRHLVLSPNGNSLTKLNTSAQLQTFPYPTASKSFLYANAFMAKSGAQSLTFKSVTNKQTDRQTKKNSAAGEIRAPPNLAWW